ncbi:TPA: hypothetical protein EYO12_03635 [Candidatus Saccharibacteria bacterium]|nr:hypothetical protein [Candidatus Saccharibacteria bacterium]HIO87877.1 hypothetical protein [Candidatus Saccharibacteria bacterium]
MRKFWHTFKQNLFVKNPKPHYSVLGTVFAVYFYGESLAPSLIPRNTLNQVLLSALTIMIFYVIGERLGAAWRRHAKYTAPAFTRRTYIAYVALLLIYAVTVTVQRMNWQTQQRHAMGLETTTPNVAVVLILSIVSIVVISMIVSCIKRLYRMLVRVYARRLRWLSKVLAVGSILFGFAVFMACVFIATRSILRSNTIALDLNVTLSESDLVSGSENSAVDWLLLSSPGRDFVGEVLTAEAISERTGQPAIEPIRLYVGKLNADTIDGQVELLMQEMERTGAFERSTIVLYTPSGSGYVNPSAVAAAEVILDGDVASVAVQYGLVSSFVQYVDDADIAKHTTALTLEAIQQKRQSMAQPPQLFLYGESLGSLGSQGSLPSFEPSEFSSSIDGALWVGSPSASGLWKHLLPQAAGDILEPVYQNGEVVRFASDVDHFGSDYDQWGEEKFAFLYNPTDPVVWVTPRLLYDKPDWLEDENAQGVYEHMRWRPFITFGQVGFELTRSINMPSGFGHNYDNEVGPAWAYVLGQPDDVQLFQQQ